MKLPQAKSFFPEFMSTCCGASTFSGICCACGHVTKMPFYFYSREQLSDNFYIEQETRIRKAFPLGVELCMLVRSKV
jgi:hypothetical protein